MHLHMKRLIKNIQIKCLNIVSQVHVGIISIIYVPSKTSTAVIIIEYLIKPEIKV